MKRSATLRLLLSSFVMLWARGANAEQLVIPVLGQTWCVLVKTPTLDGFNGDLGKSGYRFEGGGQAGFNISCFVEKPKNAKTGHEVVQEYYWSMAKRNPLIDQSSVKVSKQAKFVKVAYNMSLDSPELPKRNFNYYISHENNWIDIHVSMPDKLQPEKVMDEFEKSLRLVSLTPRSAESKPDATATPAAK